MGKSRRVQFPCGTCKKECNSDCLACEVCDQWFHSECQNISKSEFKQWSQISGEFMCQQCRQSDGEFDYLRGITRLENAARRGIVSLGEAVAREMLLLGNDRGFTAPETGSFELDTDTISDSIMKQFHHSQGRPLNTTGDGDCLFNAISIVLCGNETKSVELRYKTTLMMVHEQASILKHEDKASIMLLSPEYNDAILDCAKVSSFSSTWTVMAVAKVIGRPVQSIYPSVNGKKDLAFRCLNNTFNTESQGDPVMIMWTSISKLSQAVLNRKKQWVPNHFVAVLPLNTNEVPSPEHTSSPEKTASPENAYASSPENTCTFTENAPATEPVILHASTPATEEWEVPKKRRRSSDVTLPESINVSNKFDTLSEDEHEHFPFLSDSESFSDENIRSADITTTTPPASPASENSRSENDSKPGQVSSKGPHRGQLMNEKFITTHNILEIFSTSDGSLPNVPAGIKENMYFIGDNSENEKRQKAGLRREFWDDCGAWEKSTSPSTYLLPTENKLVTLTKRHGQFCIEKYGKVFEVVEPQPDSSDIIIVHRTYSKLKADPTYKRRVSWIGNAPSTHESLKTNVAIAEYIGTFPGRLFHGRTKTTESKQRYMKAKPSLKRKAAEMLKHESAKNVHDELNEGDDIHFMPRNLKQMQNLKYNQAKKTKTSGRDDIYLKNLADHLIHIENKVYTGNPFIRGVCHLNSGPSVILYTDEQIQDVKRFCCRDEPAVIGVDKTYNLGELHLTTMVFKNLSVLRTVNGEPPIFLGPSFLHSKSDFQTFNVFFSNIASHFTDDEIKKMVLGSDDETALRKSISRCFPGSTQTVCTRHLKNNVKDYLNKKVGVKDKDKAEIVHSLFGDNGLADANSTVIFDNRLEEVLELVEEKAGGFKPYLETRIAPMIKNQVNLPKRIRKIDKDWTNNNAESMNNILKIGTNHKVEDMTDLIDIINRIVRSQYKDCEKAIVGVGNYKLAPAFHHHELSVDVWCQKSEIERDAILKKFYADKGRKNKTVTSSDGNLTVPKTPNGGKKPYQRKRPAAERAAPRK